MKFIYYLIKFLNNFNQNLLKSKTLILTKSDVRKTTTKGSNHHQEDHFVAKIPHKSLQYQFKVHRNRRK